MLEGSRTPGPRRVSDAAPQARVASPKAPANGRSTAKSKPSDAERRKRVHYRRLLRHLGELEGFATGLHPHGRADHVSFEAFASNLRALASGLQELLGDLRSEKWTPELLEQLYREAERKALQDDLPALAVRAKSGRPSDLRRLATARRRKKVIERAAARSGAR